MLDAQTYGCYKWQSRTVYSAPVRLLSNAHERMQQMPKPYFRSNYSEVKTQFEPPFDNCVCIPLTKGHHALIDSDDFDSIIKWKWVTNKVAALFMHLQVVGKIEKKCIGWSPARHLKCRLTT